MSTCTVFCIETDFSAYLVREYAGNVLRKILFFRDPLVGPFFLEQIFEAPQKSIIIFYRQQKSCYTHNYTIPKTPEIAGHTDGHRFLDVSHTIAPKGQKCSDIFSLFGPRYIMQQ